MTHAITLIPGDGTATTTRFTDAICRALDLS